MARLSSNGQPSEGSAPHGFSRLSDNSATQAVSQSLFFFCPTRRPHSHPFVLRAENFLLVDRTPFLRPSAYPQAGSVTCWVGLGPIWGGSGRRQAAGLGVYVFVLEALCLRFVPMFVCAEVSNVM